LPGHDPVDYAKAIRRLVEAPLLREELSAGAVAHAQRFSWQRTAEHLLATYRDVLAESAEPVPSGGARVAR
jgi:D-inositol-3-phosphate glycosyltransferase